MKVALMLMTLVAAVHVGSAVKCYVCTKDVSTEDCLKDANVVDTCSNGCFKNQAVKDEMKYTRGCRTTTWKEGDKDMCETKDDKMMCSCNSDKCNSGHSLAPPSILALALVLATAKGLLM